MYSPTSSRRRFFTLVHHLFLTGATHIFTTTTTTNLNNITMPPSTHILSSKQSIGEAAASELTQIVNQLNTQSSIHIATSGGSLPETLALGYKDGKNEFKSPEKLHFWYSDERCVPLSSDDSNHKTNEPLYKALKLSQDSQQIHPIDESLIDDPAKCAAEYQQRAKKSAPNGMDVVLLGMGPDGHICSLFPDSPLNEITDKDVTHITDSPKPPPKRITFTHPVLSKAKHIIFVVTGDGKAEAVADVLENTAQSTKPAAIAVRNAKGTVSFYLDSGAASKLKQQGSSSSNKSDLSSRQTDAVGDRSSTVSSTPAAF